MHRLSPLDAGFLIAETRETPMHVGGLYLFRLPEGADETEFLGGLCIGRPALTDPGGGVLRPSAQAQPARGRGLLGADERLDIGLPRAPLGAAKASQYRE
ncbi:MAG: wax ester/triacylglycerol synthase family O-acyltransferase [Sandaracinaceae bacterium]